MIKIRGLKKRFGKQEVLKGIDLEILEGSILPVIGPNGSGKSTLMKCILGLVIPGKGTIEVGGKPVRENWEYRRLTGYMPQIARFPENLTPRELMQLVKKIRNTPAPLEQYLKDLFGLEAFMDKKLRNLSGGMRQKVNATLALMFDTPYLIIDEPTVGLDPGSRVKFKEFLKQERDQGKTILLSTHFLNEVKELSEEIAYILEGKVHFKGNLRELESRQNGHTLEQIIAEMTKNGNGKHVKNTENIKV